MSKVTQEISEAFREAGLRATPQRYAVLEYLARHAVHATAEEIFAAVNRNDPRSSRATVYNSLRSLERAGLVRQVASEGTAARYDANLRRHHHFVCERCARIEDIPWFELPPDAAARALAGREVRQYDIVFRGRCGNCRESGEGREES